MESIFLKERWKLINSGTKRSCIKIKGNQQLVNNSIYGSVEGNKFVLRADEPSPFSGLSRNIRSAARIGPPGSNLAAVIGRPAGNGP